MQENILEIEDLRVRIGSKEILKGVNLIIKSGEVHALMGPNGAGKSTLSAVLVGHPGYEVVSGKVKFRNEDLLSMPIEKRSCLGLFLSFQYPTEIPGVSMTNFLKAAINAHRSFNKEVPLSTREFLRDLKEQRQFLEMGEKMDGRAVNDGFSGGEKKKNEILQMAMLKPILSILDELDSGLDIDALQIVAKGVNRIKNDQNAFLLITHYQRLLNYVVPDFVHILEDGKIVKTGGIEIVAQLEKTGYRGIDEK